MSLTNGEKSYLRALIYPVQFEQNPLDSLDRVLDLIHAGEILDATPRTILNAVRAGLSSDERLTDFIPQSHAEEVIRAYLGAVARHLQDEVH